MGSRSRAALGVALALALGAPARADADDCARCGVPIGRNPFVKDAFGNRLHADHDHDAWGKKVSLDDPTCRVCGRSRKEQDGSYCQPCRATAVDDPDEVKASATRIVAWMASLRLRFADAPPSIDLVAEEAIGEGHPLEGNDGVARVDWAGGYFGWPGRRTSPLLVRSGLPRIVFEHVVAHEIMHAWGFLDGQPLHAHQLEEGAAEWLGSRWLTTIATAEARYYARGNARQADFRYGAGYRLAQHYVAKHGVPGLIALMRTRRDFPPTP